MDNEYFLLFMKSFFSASQAGAIKVKITILHFQGQNDNLPETKCKLKLALTCK